MLTVTMTRLEQKSRQARPRQRFLRLRWIQTFVIALLFLAAPLPSSDRCILVAAASDNEDDDTRNYYEILGLPLDAKLQDIKKSYRKLAVQTHPDRNPDDKEGATKKFRKISEAYEVLSDKKQRADYDRHLSSGGRGRGGGSGGGGNQWSWSTGSGSNGARRPHRDPFSQFNDLFQNDEFFKSAFKDMDDLFAQKFANAGSRGGGGKRKSGFNWSSSSSTSTSSGGRKSSTTRSSRSGSGWGSSGSSTYSSRSTRTVVENGKMVMIQTLEKDGNKIEEKYIAEKLVERTVNGVPEDLRIEGEF